MEKLPQEVIAEIVPYLRDEYWSGFHRYATISKAFQYAIERRLFHRLSIRSTELQYAASLLRRDHRCSSVKRIYLETVLPEYSEEASKREETQEEQDANSAAFSEAIHGLFELLRIIEDDPQSTHGSGMWISISELKSPSDLKYKYTHNGYGPGAGSTYSFMASRWKKSCVRFSDVNNLPVISKVSQLHAHSLSTNIHRPRRIEPASVLAIADKFRRLSSLDFNIRDFRKSGLEARQNRRQALKELAQAIDVVHLDTLRHLHFASLTEEPWNEERQLANLLDIHPGSIDSFSRALHNLTLSPNLVEISLKGAHFISPELYWPSTEPESAPTWPNLKYFYVNMAPFDAKGEWYFLPGRSQDEFTITPSDNDSDSGDNDLDEDSDEVSDDDSDAALSNASTEDSQYHTQTKPLRRQFRCIPDAQKIDPLLISVARAAKCMPQLHYLNLDVPREFLGDGWEWVTKRQFYVQYYARERKLSFDVLPKDWRPSSEVEQSWRETMGEYGVFEFK
ncbi:hypothetical protein BU16DRAFT_541361 [Lophium mytilinum]|uniref:F-box domain-containing protein n=1 Tax=Lophium mytilinum TaxID=390894 RepID=A0A6A6QJZ0_9PEZI|nr:hypothetical protein BU16DRAFT_541361 [Lophium mytilinum]